MKSWAFIAGKAIKDLAVWSRQGNVLPPQSSLNEGTVCSRKSPACLETPFS